MSVHVEIAPQLLERRILEFAPDEVVACQHGLTALTTYNGPGHDTMRLAIIADMTLVFVRGEGGHNHYTPEFTSAEHAADGIRLLAALLHELAY